MTGSKQLIISIDKAGYVKAEVSGVPDASRKEYITLIEEIVNGKVTAEEPTAAYYQQEQQNPTSPFNQQ